MMKPFQIQESTIAQVPVLISVPHCGLQFPEEIKKQFNPQLTQSPDDTDWFVDQLYDFAPEMGMTMISAVYSRWVIDLNRDPESKPLYTDGRIITALCPTTTFLGEPLYIDKRTEVDQTEVDRRLGLYYQPYHQKIQNILTDLKNKFGKVLLWDCHSIRQVVPTIQQEKFPDLILGDNDEKSASPELIQGALHDLGSGDFRIRHNHPFKGGAITRSFGKPAQHQNALQLEMCKVHYMDDSESKYDKARAEKMRELLKRTLGNLAEKLI
jgi:N-formylglutamate amidohydrolase